MGKKIIVRYNSDPRFLSDNHIGSPIQLTDIDEKSFNTIEEAVKFLSECSLPITRAEQLIPELRKLKKPFEWVLSEAGIKPEHLLVGNLEAALEKSK